jgi:hypothetical protein
VQPIRDLAIRSSSAISYTAALCKSSAIQEAGCAAEWVIRVTLAQLLSAADRA